MIPGIIYIIITIDSKTQGIAGTTKLKKVSNQKTNSKSLSSQKAQEGSNGETVNNIADIGGMLFL